MAIYSIRDLEKLTGIKAHTIRIWEQRYHLVEPARTDTNIRFYTDENLRHIFNVALLNRNGYKISKLARMKPDEIDQKVAQIANNSAGPNTQIDALTLAMIDMDEARFESIFKAFAEEHGFEDTILNLVYPFLDKLNVLWLAQSVSPAHEKFITNLIRRKIMVAIDQAPANCHREAATFLLFLPLGENQELSLLFLNYLLRKKCQKVVYLGANTDVNDLRDACQMLHPDYLYTILTDPLPKQTLQSYINQLAATAPEAHVLLTGPQMFLNHVLLPENAQVLNGLPGTLDFLDQLTARSPKG